MSVIAAALKHMLASGMPHEAIVAAVADMEAAAAPVVPARSSGAERQARYRARKASQSVTGDVTSVTVTDEVSPKKETSPTPPKEKTTPSQSVAIATSQKRGCRLPDDFVADLSVAVSLGLPPSQAQTEAAKFADYWRSAAGSKGVKLDWEATWRNWVRSAVERLPKSRGSPPRTSTSALADSAARLAQTMRTADEIRSGSSGSGVRAAIPHLPVR